MSKRSPNVCAVTIEQVVFVLAIDQYNTFTLCMYTTHIYTTDTPVRHMQNLATYYNHTTRIGEVVCGDLTQTRPYNYYSNSICMYMNKERSCQHVFKVI